MPCTICYIDGGRMTNKICTGCKLEKLFEEFGKDKKGKFGLNQKCKECCKARAKLTIRSPLSTEKQKKYRAEWQRKKRPILNAKLRQRHLDNLEESRAQARERQKRYMATEKGKLKHIEATKEYEKNNAEKIKAQRKIRRAILSGKLLRSKFCEICFKECKTHGHHEDYAKPLEVIWMCPKCHLYHHQKYRFHAERASEETSKEDAVLRTTEETCRGT